MKQHSQKTNGETQKAAAPTRLYAGMAAIVVALVLAASAQAQSVIQIPFVSTVAGIAPGGSATACSTSSDIATFNGTTGTSVPMHYGDGCLPTQATLLTPYTTAVDALGNIYIADYGHFALRVIYNGSGNGTDALAKAIIGANPTIANLLPQRGHVYTLAGGSRTGTLGKTAGPSGSLYYCNTAGSGTTALATDTSSVAGDGCPGSQAYVKPRTIALDADGNVFFTSTVGGQSVRVIYVQGTAAMNLITEENPGVTPQPGFMYGMAGVGAPNGYSGDGGLARTASLYSVRDVAVDANENLYISDGANTPTASDNLIRKITASTGFISTLAGGVGCTPSSGCPGGTIGGSDGDGALATNATFNSPYALFLDANANVYVADYSNARVRVIYQGTGTVVNVPSPQTGYIYTVAGGGATAAVPANSGLPATQLAFAVVQVASMDPAGNIYLFDSTSRYLWKVDGKTGIATFIGGLGTTPAAISGNFCAGTAGPKSTDTNGDGCPSTQVSMSSQGQYSFDPQGNFYETESTNAVVRKFSLNTQFAATAVGTPVTQPLAFLTVGGASTLTAENFALQSSGTTEFSDAGSNTCSLGVSIPTNTTCVFNVKFSPGQAGLRTGAFAFTGATVSNFLSGVGQAAEASIDSGTETTIGAGLKPSGLGTDLLGSLYIADTTSNTVKKVAAAGGTPSTLISGLSNPGQIAVDGKGNVYVADTGNNRIAMTTSAGGTITALGTGLSAPAGVAVDGLGNVFVADTGNHRIVKLFANGGQRTYALTGTNAAMPTSLALDAAGDLFVVDKANGSLLELAANVSQATVNLGTTGIVPSSVAVDTAGDLYVTDATNLQVVEFLAGSTNGNPIVRGLATPTGIATDVNGSLYIADSGLSFPAASVTAYSVTSNVVSVIANNNYIAGMSVSFTGLTTATFLNGQTLTVLPTGLSGSQFQVAFTHANASGSDTGTATPQTPVGVIAVNRTLTTVDFPITNLGQPSPAPITFTNTGNLPLLFTGSQFASAAGSTTQFSLASASSNGCVLGTPVAVAASCALTATFAPIATGLYSETISPVTNAANNGSLSGALSGLGVQLIGTTTNLSITAPTTSSIFYGQPVTVTSTTTLASNGGTPVGIISFTVDGIPQAPIAFGTGTAPIPLPNLAVQSHAVSVSVTFSPIAGVPVYASSGSSLSVNVLKAATTTTLAITPTASGTAAGTQFTATIVSSTAIGETGTVNFYSGTTLLNPAPIVVSSVTNGGTASYTTTAVSFPANSFTAVYTGDNNFVGSTSSVTTPAGDFNLTAGSTVVEIPQNGNTTIGITVTPYFLYSGTITPSCTGGLPTYTICRFQPVSAPVNGAVLPAAITAYSVDFTTGIVTLTAANNFVAGTQVSFSGLGSATFLNGQTLQVLSTGLSATQFEVTYSHTTASGAEGGFAAPVTPVTFTVELYTSTNLTSQNREGGPGVRTALAMLSPIGMAVLLFARRRRLLGRTALLALVLMFSLAGVAGLSGCTNPPAVAPGGTTPASTQTVTVTFKDANTPQVSHSIGFTFNVCNVNVSTSCQTF